MTLLLSQSDYIRKLLRCFDMENVKPTPISLPTLIRLSNRDSPSTDEKRELNGKIPYASAVGSIMYAMVVTRLDLAYVVGVVSRYMSKTQNGSTGRSSNTSSDTYGALKMHN